MGPFLYQAWTRRLELTQGNESLTRCITRYWLEMSRFDEPRQRKGLALLCLDGGGVRGLSSLYILKQLMETISIQNPPKPCDYFDMIGGTSTGGLIAIMLGRLHMGVDECIVAYETIAPKIFAKVHHRLNLKGKVQGRFDHLAIEEAVKELLRKCGLREDELLQSPAPDSCKTHVSPPKKKKAIFLASSFF